MASILVVDDEIGIRELLTEILSDEGHEVRTAENAQQAREACTENVPDLVLLDIWMPDTDGLTLLKEWRRNGLPYMPVVMMSGHGTIDTAVEATKVGALDFLEKPISMKKLFKAVKNGLSPRKKHPKVVVDKKQPIVPVIEMISNAEEGVVASVTVNGVTADAHGTASEEHTLAQDVTKRFTFSFDLPLRAAREAFERIYFEYHIVREDGSMTRVAEKAGLERTHLYRKLKQLKLDASKIAKKNND